MGVVEVGVGGYWSVGVVVASEVCGQRPWRCGQVGQ